LEEALSLQILITILVIIVMIYNLRASFLISSLLPIAVLMVFIAMRYFGVDANIVALSGIAIAIGTMVDLGIILSENIVKHVDEAPPGQKLTTTIYNGSAEVSSAILTAVSTTIVSFIPVFTMQAAEGKLFGPLAFTKTFALVAALIVSLIILPTLAHWFFGFKIKNPRHNKWVNMLLIAVGFIGLFSNVAWAGILLILFGGIPFIKPLIRDKKLFRKPLFGKILDNIELILVVIGVVWLLAKYWLPLGAGKSVLLNFVFVALLVGFILGAFTLLQFSYRRILRWCLNNKVKFLMIPVFLMLLGVNIWMGFSNIFGFLANGADKMGWNIRTTAVWSGLNHSFPGMGKEFMPSLGEGSFLLMPTSMPLRS
jgi:Cu(I)/Ag(I) efflux system membrane protein CusA/SilA